MVNNYMSLPNLTNEFIADSYRGVLHTSNQPVTGSELRQVYDGLGNPTALKISSTTIGVGNFTFPTNGTLGQTLIFDSGGNLTAGSLFPVGSVYFTTTDTNPGTFLGGTWVRIAQGRFIAGVGTGNDGDRSQEIVSGNSGGKYTHTLTESEMPSHDHEGISIGYGKGSFIRNSGRLSENFSIGSGRSSKQSDIFVPIGGTTPFYHQGEVDLEDSGGDLPHNNTPPAFGLFVWNRTA
jgi:hypothetical protein